MERKLRFVVWAGVLALTFCVAAEARDKKTKDTLYLDSRDILQVEFSVSLNPRLQVSSPGLADSTRDWQERMFREVLEPAIERAEFPMRYVLLGERQTPAKGEPVLRLRAVRWEEGFTGEIEAVLQVNLHAYGYRQKIGMYRNSEYPMPGMSKDLRDKAYKESLRKSLQEAFYGLLPNFEEPPEAPEESLAD